jgi:hypothetical protein
MGPEQAPWAPHLSHPTPRRCEGREKLVGRSTFPWAHRCAKGPGTFQGCARPAHFILWRVLGTPAGYVYKPGALSSNWQYGTNQYRSRVAIRPTTGATAKGHLDIGNKLYNMYAWLCFFQLGTSPTPPQKRDGGPLQNSDTKTDPRKQ